MNNSNKPVLVLDLDGTLVDSKPDLVAALNVGITGFGLDEISPDLVGETVGHGARAMIARACEVQDKILEEEKLEQVFDLFLDYYHQNVAVYSKPYSGAQNALDRFSDDGWLLAVCTNKPEDLAIKLLEALDMNEQFAAICGADTFDTKKPHGGHILNTIRTAKGSITGSVMVGDTATDINAAKNSGIPSIAVSFGYSREPAETLGAHQVISHFNQLWTAVNRL